MRIADMRAREKKPDRQSRGTGPDFTGPSSDLVAASRNFPLQKRVEKWDRNVVHPSDFAVLLTTSFRP